MEIQVESIGMNFELSLDIESAQDRVTEALKVEGFGVLTEIDIQKTLKNKLDVDYKPYKILGACNPKLAYEALETTTEIGLLLPCNVTLQQNESGKTEVSFVDPLRLIGFANHPGLEAVAEEAATRLRRVKNNLEKK
jgi:uncharacterized protein (DUF302 family)